MASMQDGDIVVCSDAWVAEVVGRRWPKQRVCGATRWSLVDRFVPRLWHDISDELAQLQAGAGPRASTPCQNEEDDEARARVALALENRRLAALLVEQAPKSELVALAATLLPTLHPLALGGDVDATRAGLHVLRSACRALGLDSDAGPPSRQGGIELKGRVKALSLGSDDFGVTWSRANGCAWRSIGGHAASDFCAIEVQADANPDGAFAVLAPERPRRFLLSDFRPTCKGPAKAQDGGPAWLRLEREFAFSSDPLDKAGRKRIHDCVLDLEVDAAARRIGIALSLSGALARHRYRLCVPLAFWPRPTSYTIGGVEARIDGPFGATPVDGHLDFHHGKACVRVHGCGIVEAELLPLRNDLVCAITLCRDPASAVALPRIERRFVIEVREAD